MKFWRLCWSRHSSFSCCVPSVYWSMSSVSVYAAMKRSGQRIKKNHPCQPSQSHSYANELLTPTMTSSRDIQQISRTVCNSRTPAPLLDSSSQSDRTWESESSPLHKLLPPESHKLISKAAHCGQVLEVCEEVLHGRGPNVPLAVLDAVGIDVLPVDFVLSNHYLVGEFYALAPLVGLVNVQLHQLQLQHPFVQ